jgi:hypothetical protein
MTELVRLAIRARPVTEILQTVDIGQIEPYLISLLRRRPWLRAKVELQATEICHDTKTAAQGLGKNSSGWAWHAL